MSGGANCPVCLLNGPVVTGGLGDRSRFSCEVCGTFEISGSALPALAPERDEITPIKRAILSHRIREASDAQGVVPLVTSNQVQEAITAGALPSPGRQAINLLRFIGETVSLTGNPISSLPLKTYAIIGSPSFEAALRIAAQLVQNGLLLGSNNRADRSPWGLAGLEPSLQGWERYEAERAGQVAGSYGFMALKFGDEILDPFMRNVIKPAVESVGYQLEDMRDAARAGIIDNVMRARIRDAAFILVDLTHANAGAYWEAGYAEGLGKPVLYLCKQDVFDREGTHFDTNHCTTIMWDPVAPDKFSEDLVATLRRSLGLF